MYPNTYGKPTSAEIHGPKRHAIPTAHPRASENQDTERVDDGDECPTCGECRVDWLAIGWDATGYCVDCASCGTNYSP